jgi:hypothetical protein
MFNNNWLSYEMSNLSCLPHSFAKFGRLVRTALFGAILMMSGCNIFAPVDAQYPHPTLQSVKVDDDGSRSVRPTPHQVTVDDRVAQSDLIFVGEPVRIYFVDKEYKEVPYEDSVVETEDPQSHLRLRRALLEIKVNSVLWEASPKERKHVLFPLSPVAKEIGFFDRSSIYEELSTKYIGHKGIWFGHTLILAEYYEIPSDGGFSKKQTMRDAVELFHPKFWVARSHRVPNPMPLSDLEEVKGSIRMLKTK